MDGLGFFGLGKVEVVFDEDLALLEVFNGVDVLLCHH
jgi:hypothetical protein